MCVIERERSQCTNCVFFEQFPSQYCCCLLTGPLFIMNLEKVSDEEKLQICRKYFIGGFFCLPFLWLVNSLWFFREAFLTKNANPMLRRYVGVSIVGTIIWTGVVILWTSVFQTQRSHWLPFSDYISVTIPVGQE